MNIELFPKQIEFVSAKERELLFDAGIGNGKTTVLGLLLGMTILQHPKKQWLLVARDHGQLSNVTTKEFEIAMEKWLDLKEGRDYKKVKSPSIKYEFWDGSVVDAVGAHNYDSVFRGGNYSGGFGDEVDYWKPEAWLAFKGRIRVAPEILRVVSSPKGYNHIYDDFYINKGDDSKVINASTYDNPLLSDAYIESLKRTYSPRMFEQEVLGKRLRIQVGAVYNEFDRKKHVKECSHILKETDQLYFFLDYNVAHYCGVYLIHRRELNKSRQEINKVYCIAEEHLQYKHTKDMAAAIKAKFPDRLVIVCGDSAGNRKRDVAVERVNYEIFKDFGHHTINYRNPPVQSRIISANSNFYHNQVVIDPVCKNTIKDLELLAYREDGKEIEKTIDLSHASDALTYGLYHFISVIKPRKTYQKQL